MRIALYQPDIPQNTGNIIRLAACFNFPVDIIEPASFFLDDKRMKRAAMDYLNHTSITRHIDWLSFKQWSKKNNFRIILLTTKGSKNYFEFFYNNNDIILLGRESAGVNPEIHQDVDERIVIPVQKGLRSLNVSSAAAIVVGEAFRQLQL